MSIKTVTRELHTSSNDGIRLHAPSAWKELTQQQLLYVLEMLTLFPNDKTTIKTYMFIRFTGLKMIGRYGLHYKFSYLPDGEKKREVFYMEVADVAGMLHHFDFIDSYDDMDIRLEKACGMNAVDIYLRGVTFQDYIVAEKNFQCYLINQDTAYLVKLLHILYRDDNKQQNLVPSSAEMLGVFLWYSFIIKPKFARTFPNFFKPAASSSGKAVDIAGMINAQIRALTGGDITKEKEVFETDCWRALAELDAKAREAKEIERQLKQNGV